jgi:hypothetical protein
VLLLINAFILIYIVAFLIACPFIPLPLPRQSFVSFSWHYLSFVQQPFLSLVCLVHLSSMHPSSAKVYLSSNMLLSHSTVHPIWHIFFLSLLYFQSGWLLFLLLKIEEPVWGAEWVINEYSFSASNKQLLFNVLTNFVLRVYDAIGTYFWGMCSIAAAYERRHGLITGNKTLSWRDNFLYKQTVWWVFVALPHSCGSEVFCDKVLKINMGMRDEE